MIKIRITKKSKEGKIRFVNGACVFWIILFERS